MIFVVHDEHGRVAHLVDVEILEVVEVALVATHLQPRIVVLLHVLLPAVDVGIVGDGIDVEVALADGLERVIDLAELLGLLLTGRAVGVVEPEDGVGLAHPVGGVPLGHILGHGGVGDDELRRDVADEDGGETGGTLLVFGQDVFVEPVALAGHLVGHRDVVEHRVVTDDLAGLKLIGEPVAAIMVHKRVRLGLLQEDVDVFVDGVRLLMIEHFQEVVLHFGIEGGNVDETVVAKVHVVPIVQPVVGRLFLDVVLPFLVLELGNVDVLV